MILHRRHFRSGYLVPTLTSCGNTFLSSTFRPDPLDTAPFCTISWESIAFACTKNRRAHLEMDRPRRRLWIGVQYSSISIRGSSILGLVLDITLHHESAISSVCHRKETAHHWTILAEPLKEGDFGFDFFNQPPDKY